MKYFLLIVFSVALLSMISACGNSGGGTSSAAATASPIQLAKPSI